MEPFEYALANGFDAFEFFPDKKPDGRGWDENDLDGATRRHIREAAAARRMRLSVHARWQANPLQPDSYPLLWKDLELAQDLGAVLLNIHLCHEQGISAFAEAIDPLARRTADAGIQLSIENTPHHTPELFNELFAHLADAIFLSSQPAGLGNADAIASPSIGMCLDLGHANLCATTRNDFLGYLDRLDARVPIIHLHLHENWGDQDSHLPIFTGPAGRNDTGVRGLLKRLLRRNFSGSFILEQWPQPPSLLNNARERIARLWSDLLASAERTSSRPPASSAATPGKREKRVGAGRDASEESSSPRDVRPLPARESRAKGWRKN